MKAQFSEDGVSASSRRGKGKSDVKALGSVIEWFPRVGTIYRDIRDQSLLVLTVQWDSVLIERGNGEMEVIDIFQWRDLQPVPAPC